MYNDGGNDLDRSGGSDRSGRRTGAVDWTTGVDVWGSGCTLCKIGRVFRRRGRPVTKGVVLIKWRVKESSIGRVKKGRRRNEKDGEPRERSKVSEDK